MSRLDSLDIWGATLGLPDQLVAAAASSSDLGPLPAHDDIENVLILGMGGSGIAGDIIINVAGPFMPVPVVVTKTYAPPGFVSESTLCFAVSFSGDTEEVVESASAAALEGARMVCVTGGGELAKLADSWGAAYAPIAPGIPMPRCGVGAMTVPILSALNQVGMFPVLEPWLADTVEQLRRRAAQLSADKNPALDLARRIGGTMPLIYGEGLGAVAAARWKAQCNENPKIPAFTAAVPELCHNEICGWGQHGDITRQVFSVVHLRHDEEHPQVMRRFDLVAEILDEVVGGVHEVEAEGDSRLAKLFDLMLYGDFVSMYLAFEAGVDPGPIPVLQDLKRALAAD